MHILLSHHIYATSSMVYILIQKRISTNKIFLGAHKFMLQNKNIMNNLKHNENISHEHQQLLNQIIKSNYLKNSLPIKKQKVDEIDQYWLKNLLKQIFTGDTATMCRLISHPRNIYIFFPTWNKNIFTMYKEWQFDWLQ